MTRSVRAHAASTASHHYLLGPTQPATTTGEIMGLQAFALGLEATVL